MVEVTCKYCHSPIHIFRMWGNTLPETDVYASCPVCNHDYTLHPDGRIE
jgi:hypothetical protein